MFCPSDEGSRGDRRGGWGGAVRGWGGGGRIARFRVHV